MNGLAHKAVVPRRHHEYGLHVEDFYGPCYWKVTWDPRSRDLILEAPNAVVDAVREWLTSSC
jgi:hypothetical protein